MIQFTENAVKEVKRLLEQEKTPGLALRVGVKGGGCSGLTYVMGFEAQPKENDQTFETAGVKVFVDPKSHLYLDGTTIDYVSNLMGSGFAFNNPNAKHSCGCGTSFNA
ncbi:MAG: iron-sulfur cluster insertion protein ErpA [Candidatus Omnitrophica bacterium]|nr:iron-sulfur cluster insertion protein ErpA [Candidatus Omnitrophota bacterium]